MHLNRLFRIGDVKPASIRLPSCGDNLDQGPSHWGVRNVRDAVAAGLYIHFHLLILLYRVCFDEFYVHAGVLDGNAFLSAGHFNGNSRLCFAGGRRSLRLGSRRRRILRGGSVGTYRTCSEAYARKKLCRESHKSMNSMVYGTAGRVKSRRVKFGCDSHGRCCPPLLRRGNPKHWLFYSISMAPVSSQETARQPRSGNPKGKFTPNEHRRPPTSLPHVPNRHRP